MSDLVKYIIEPLTTKEAQALLSTMEFAYARLWEHEVGGPTITLDAEFTLNQLRDIVAILERVKP